MSQTEIKNKEISRSHAEDLINEGKLDHINDHVADDYVWHRLGAAESIHGPDEVREFISGMRTAFPDLEVTVEDIFAEDDKVVRRDRLTGTHEGEFMGIQPTGKEIEIQSLVINQIDDGQMVESWGQSDVLGLMKQLGFFVVPGPRLALRMVIGTVKSRLFGE